MRLRSEYEEKLEVLRKENWKLTEEIRTHNEQFHKEKKEKEDLINRISGIESENKGLKKKKNKDDINNAYTITRLTYLEEEMKRLKEEKKKIKDKDLGELKIQVEKLLDESMNLKKQIHDLQTQLDENRRRGEAERKTLVEEYEKKIKEFNERITVIEKEKTTIIEKYESRITEIEGGSRGEIENLKKQLQEEKDRNKDLEDKMKESNAKLAEANEKILTIEKEKTTIIEKYETKIV